MIVVCGKNQVVKRQLESEEWPENVRVVVNGFVTNMDEWMSAVDALVTKAGPGTIAEATIRGLPVMLSGYLPGQEEGNVPYVVNGEACAHAGLIHEVASCGMGPDGILELRGSQSVGCYRPAGAASNCASLM